MTGEPVVAIAVSARSWPDALRQVLADHGGGIGGNAEIDVAVADSGAGRDRQPAGVAAGVGRTVVL